MLYQKLTENTIRPAKFEDIAKLLDSFNELVNNGHTVIIIDIGPERGFAGGIPKHRDG